MPELETFVRMLPETWVVVSGCEVRRWYLINVLRELEDTEPGMCELTVLIPQLADALVREGVAERCRSGSQLFRGEQYLEKRKEWFPEEFGG